MTAATRLGPVRTRRASSAFVALLAPLAILAGCQSKGPIVVDLTYVPSEDVGSIVAIPGRPIVHLSPPVDGRSNRDTIGLTTAPIIPGSDVSQWVQEGLASLEDFDAVVVFSGSDPQDGYRLAVTVTRVYCRSMKASLRGTVVLSVEFVRAGSLLGKRVFSGQMLVEDRSIFKKAGRLASSNYRFNEGRALQVLNGALTDAVAQIAETIAELEAE